MSLNYLDQQLAKFIAPHNDAVQSVVMRLSSELAKGHSCMRLTEQEQQLLQDFQHDGLIQQGDLLYLKRYADYEQQLASQLSQLASRGHKDNKAFTKADIETYFNDAYQASAAALALNESLALITGGPGTGKTTTVVKILALLLKHDPQLNIALSAPTGKAAMRLQESISGSKQHLTEFDSSVIEQIPESVKTIHRLLGAKPLSSEFRHNPLNPVLADVVVVDEASMIDLALMVKLVEALKPNAKLILLGDKDQLASVESGAVLADCYEALSSHRVELTNTYRFEGKIKQLAQGVNKRASGEVISLLRQCDLADPLEWFDKETASLKLYILSHYKTYFEQAARVSSFADIDQAFDQFNSFQVLAATRQGSRGVAVLNSFCENQLKSQSSSSWYAGRAIMISRNDRNTQLFNGDIGLCLPSPEHNGQLRVFFPDGNGFRNFVPSRLPSHETAFAMTIHKSQGSEFSHVLIVLPEQLDDENQLITKELLYTAITRGKQQVSIQAGEATLKRCVSSQVDRVSGLKQRLLEAMQS